MIKIDLPKQLLQKAIYMAMASNKRTTTKYYTNTLITDVMQQEIAQYQNALNTLTEIK